MNNGNHDDGHCVHLFPYSGPQSKEETPAGDPQRVGEILCLFAAAEYRLL
jgi:hypothetical protein